MRTSVIQNGNYSLMVWARWAQMVLRAKEILLAQNSICQGVDLASPIKPITNCTIASCTKKLPIATSCTDCTLCVDCINCTSPGANWSFCSYNLYYSKVQWKTASKNGFLLWLPSNKNKARFGFIDLWFNNNVKSQRIYWLNSPQALEWNWHFEAGQRRNLSYCLLFIFGKYRQIIITNIVYRIVASEFPTTLWAIVRNSRFDGEAKQN